MASDFLKRDILKNRVDRIVPGDSIDILVRILDG